MVRPVALPNGRAMVAGGGTDDVVILDPDTGRWSYGPNVLRERGYHSTVVLSNGCVLVAGGSPGDSPRGYDTAETLCAEPAATPAAVTVPDDVPTSIRLVGTSNYGPPSGYRIVTEPAHGTLTGVAPDLVYSPGPAYSGPDEFSFVASVGADESPPATVTIEVVPFDDPPVASDLEVETAQGEPLSIRLTATDVDSTSFTFRIVEPPAGALSPGPMPEEFLYSPRQGFVGEDGFAYVASDGTTESAPGRVTIHVRPAGDPDPDGPRSGAMESGCGCGAATAALVSAVSSRSALPSGSGAAGARAT